MQVIYNCLVEDHDLRLVLLAVVVCGLGTFTAMNLMSRARQSEAKARWVWLGTAALALGAGIWSTHFIAMLAYSPGLPVGYDIVLTLASVVLAVLVTGLGLGIHLHRAERGAAALAGVIVGLGIGAMHFTGMSALQVPGRISYDTTIFLAAWTLGVAFCAAALHVARDCRPLRSRAAGAGLLAAGIAALHFTAMGAVVILPDPMVGTAHGVVSPGWLAVSIAGATFIILLLSLAGAIFDQHLAQRSSEEAERLQDLANASAEGIVICQDRVILDANRSFLALTGMSLEEVRGKDVTVFLEERTYHVLLRNLAAGALTGHEGMLRGSGDATVPVELGIRTMKQRGTLRQVLSVRDMRERKMAEERIQHLAHHDPLTDLANRALFTTRLEHDIARAQRSGEQLAVMCLDLDRFKEINDVYGHPTGDAILGKVAARLRQTVRETDTVSRLGGDEFAILQVGMGQPEAAHVLAHRLVSRLNKPYELAEGELQTGVSIGIAIYPNDGEDVDTLLRNADLALYRAKETGRGSYCFFEAEMDERLREQRMLEVDLRQAIERGQMHLVYQPQARASTSEIVGFEALLRWQHPTKGMIPPDHFIPLAEQCGYIGKLGLWVLREACREAARWSRPLRIAVNLSPVQFQHGRLAEEVERTLEETGLDPARLELEITEGVLMKERERALEVLRRLKALGVRVAMDDFGTGYSSLSSLQAFPFDKIKIDRSFVMKLTENSEAQAIVRAVLALGKGLKLPVVAEGVESASQLELLRGENCEEIQGYLIGKPLAIESYAMHLGEVRALAEPPAEDAA